MRYVPESAEVVRETLSDLQQAVELGHASGDPAIPAAEFMPKFLQGCYFLSQYTLAIFSAIRYYLEELGGDSRKFSFDDIVEFHDDEHRVILDGLFKNFIMEDSENFRQLITLSYCQGFDATVPWFLALITTLNYLEDSATGEEVYDNGGDGEEAKGEEDYS